MFDHSCLALAACDLSGSSASPTGANNRLDTWHNGRAMVVRLA